jgi:hypothetical protein
MPGSMAEGTHSYFDWQVSTLMLAYDTVEPLDREDEPAHVQREQAVHRELYELAHAILPEDYLKNPTADFPPEIVMLMTRATVARAAQIMGMTEPADDEIE